MEVRAIPKRRKQFLKESSAFRAVEPLRLHCKFNVSISIARTFAGLGEG